ncbi:MAG: RidA family protein [candidate division WOR-3 bacterium]|nr:RidA family protein [candidate division WOR-3 bacterium]
MSNKKIVFTEKAPVPIGPYSQAVIVDRFVFISGQIGIDPKTGQLVNGGISEEIRQIFKNIKEILNAVGVDFNSIVKTTVYLTDLSEFSVVNTIYSEYFVKDFPARATVEVKALPKGAKVEIEAIAVIE